TIFYTKRACHTKANSPYAFNGWELSPNTCQRTGKSSDGNKEPNIKVTQTIQALHGKKRNDPSLEVGATMTN
ncbi:hypothetical protein J1N35_037784, partial [Gossypium stocksii]